MQPISVICLVLIVFTIGLIVGWIISTNGPGTCRGCSKPIGKLCPSCHITRPELREPEPVDMSGWR